jgi:cellulose synthase/poly-beta-1,6-N-acetylglucosamine synthase-like glycosyltransferase
METLHSVLQRVESVILVYFLVVNSFYGLLLASAAWEMRSYRLRSWHEDQSRLLGSPVAPRISMLAPAHNEGPTVAESVRSLLTLRYPNLEVVLINDGSTDDTLAVLLREFGLVPVHPVYDPRVEHKAVVALYRSPANPGLVVVDKENGGKADALNAGMNVASGDLACAIDADTLIEADALLRMVAPFLTADDVVATGGTIRVANAATVRAGRVLEARVPRQAVAGIQVAEYLRAFLVGRLGWNRLGGNLIISGAFGLFRRDAVLAAGGYTEGTVGEDMELVVRLRRRGLDQGSPHRIVFVPDPVAWTEVPSSMKVLGRQRDRWHRGLSDVVWRNRGLFLNPRYRSLGLAVFPYYVVVELLAPVVEAFGLVSLTLGVATGALDWGFAALFFLVAYGYALVLDVLTLLLEELSYRRYHSMRDRMWLLLWAALGSVGYRQCTVYWRLRGIKQFLQKRTDWGTMTRSGFTPVDVEPGAEQPE